jgi:DNA-directed RNA polymerase specialized sigma subunit
MTRTTTFPGTLPVEDSEPRQDDAEGHAEEQSADWEGGGSGAGREAGLGPVAPTAGGDRGAEVRGKLGAGKGPTDRTRASAARRARGLRTGATRLNHGLKDFPEPTEHSERLIEENLGLAWEIAWRFARRSNKPYAELETEAYLGLIRGCRKYDPNRINPDSGRPYALSTCVVPFIQGAILHYFRDRGFLIQLPAKWRERWGKVQRLLEDPDLTPEQVAEKAGLGTDELAEMTAAMTGVLELNEEVVGSSSAEVELDLLEPLRGLRDQAWANLHPSDRELISGWFERHSRRTLPQLSLKQFQVRAKRLLAGTSLQEFRQIPLLAVVSGQKGDKATTRKQRSKKELDASVAQLALFVAGESLN